MPSLDFNLWILIPLSSEIVWPVGIRLVGAKKQLRPLEVRARRTVMAESVAEENHLNPSIRQGPRDWPSGAVPTWSPMNVATVSVCDTSLPPVRSVIHCPDVHAFTGSVEVRRSNADWRTGRSFASIFELDSWDKIMAAAPSCIALGQVTVAELPDHRWYFRN